VKRLKHNESSILVKKLWMIFEPFYDYTSILPVRAVRWENRDTRCRVKTKSCE
jgi:hypothetical protein